LGVSVTFLGYTAPTVLDNTDPYRANAIPVNPANPQTLVPIANSYFGTSFGTTDEHRTLIANGPLSLVLDIETLYFSLTLGQKQTAFFQNQSGGDVTITFVGEVPQGSLSNHIGANFGFYSSQVPQAGTLTALAFPGTDFMTFNAWNPTNQIFNQAYLYFGGWFNPANQPQDPVVGVAEGFLISNPNAPIGWTRTFSVNNN
jgi:hypothetical protein